MELRHLRSFVLVAETASFSVAASRCYLTQSVVSHHIRQSLMALLFFLFLEHLSITKSTINNLDEDHKQCIFAVPKRKN